MNFNKPFKYLYLLPLKNGKYFKIGIGTNNFKRVIQHNITYDINLNDAIIYFSKQNKLIRSLETELLCLTDELSDNPYQGLDGYTEVRNIDDLEKVIKYLNSKPKTLNIKSFKYLSLVNDKINNRKNNENINNITKNKNILYPEWGVSYIVYTKLIRRLIKYCDYKIEEENIIKIRYNFNRKDALRKESYLKKYYYWFDYQIMDNINYSLFSKTIKLGHLKGKNTGVIGYKNIVGNIKSTSDSWVTFEFPTKNKIPDYNFIPSIYLNNKLSVIERYAIKICDFILFSIKSNISKSYITLKYDFLLEGKNQNKINWKVTPLEFQNILSKLISLTPAQLIENNSLELNSSYYNKNYTIFSSIIPLIIKGKTVYKFSLNTNLNFI